MAPSEFYIAAQVMTFLIFRLTRNGICNSMAVPDMVVSNKENNPREGQPGHNVTIYGSARDEEPVGVVDD